MQKISLENLEKDCYIEKLDNGLEIYMIPYENKKNYYISYATRFGSDVVEYTDLNSDVHVPPLGIAHFLEHKMFEQEDGVDPFTFFSKSGTDANASTSFDSTQYICYGTKNFKDNLKFLIRYVDSPYYTDENVLKEKGIIAEEIKMYEDMPDFKLEMALRRAVYKNHSRRIDIAGSIEEINKITKEDLYSCYENFYVPNNMFMLIVGNFDKDEAVSIIANELDYKRIKVLPKIKAVNEPINVNQKEVVIKENISVPKIGFALKVPSKVFNIPDVELDLYLNMLTTILYGSSSLFRERCRLEKLYSGIYLDWESCEGFKTFYIMASTNEVDKLISEIKSELENIVINDKTFNRIKKVWISNEVRMIDNIHATVNNVYDDILKYKKIIPDRIEMIKRMKIKTLNSIIKNIDFNNISVVKMISNNN